MYEKILNVSIIAIVRNFSDEYSLQVCKSHKLGTFIVFYVFFYNIIISLKSIVSKLSVRMVRL